MKEPEKKEEGPSEAATRAAKKKDEAPAPPETRRPVSGYVFKIAPADPKNSGHFEDVADK
jgi:hypothetical protein